MKSPMDINLIDSNKSEKLFVIIKKGHFWRDGGKGYTSSIASAGLYTEKEARDACDVCDSVFKYKPVHELFNSEDDVEKLIQKLLVIKEQIKYHKENNEGGMLVKFILGIGFAGATHKELIDLPNDYTEDDIEEMYQGWANNFLDKSRYILEDIDDVG